MFLYVNDHVFNFICRGDVDFLEFMISVWNVCTCRVDSLSNFAFDMYDLDSDGELSVPEIEHMVWEFFGKGGGGRCLEDATKYAEQRGGAMKLWVHFSDVQLEHVYRYMHSFVFYSFFFQKCIHIIHSDA